MRRTVAIEPALGGLSRNATGAPGSSSARALVRPSIATIVWRHSRGKPWIRLTVRISGPAGTKVEKT